MKTNLIFITSRECTVILTIKIPFHAWNLERVHTRHPIYEYESKPKIYNFSDIFIYTYNILKRYKYNVETSLFLMKLYNKMKRKSIKDNKILLECVFSVLSLKKNSIM